MSVVENHSSWSKLVVVVNISSSDNRFVEVMASSQIYKV
jgi:hypothetical protein